MKLQSQGVSDQAMLQTAGFVGSWSVGRKTAAEVTGDISGYGPMTSANDRSQRNVISA
jgi:hypothetical protein